MEFAEVAVDALSIWLVFGTLLILFLFPAICLDAYVVSSSFDRITMYAWESMIPLGFFAATGYFFFFCNFHSIFHFVSILEVSIPYQNSEVKCRVVYHMTEEKRERDWRLLP